MKWNNDRNRYEPERDDREAMLKANAPIRKWIDGITPAARTCLSEHDVAKLIDEVTWELARQRTEERVG
jgi:hypothetical protein